MQIHSDSQRGLVAELLACAVWRLFPNVQLIGGGANSLGFFYDFFFEQPIAEEMLEVIEAELHRLIREGNLIHFRSMMRENARNFLKHHHQLLLADQLISEGSNIVELIEIGNFYDLSPSFSFSSTLEGGAVKLLDYLEIGERKGRIVGICQPTPKELKSFLKTYGQFLKKKDHRLLGPALNLFDFSSSTGCLGLIWHPKGITLCDILREWIMSELPEGYRQISTPLVVREDFLSSAVRSPSSAQVFEPFVFEGVNYRLRHSPIQQHLDYLNKFFTEELPEYIVEFAPVYQHYPEFQREGLLCSCSYLTEAMTICCEKKQIIPQLISSLQFIERIITIFGFEAQWALVALRQKNSTSQREAQAIGWLKEALQEKKMAYPISSEISEEEGKEAPRLELRIRDALGRMWPMSTLNVHFFNEKERASWVVLTRCVWSSLERFIALLLEHYEGNLPLWLMPEQVRIIAIGEKNQDYARQIRALFQQKQLRTGLDVSQGKLSEKIHNAEKERIPYLILIGEQERIKQKISVRSTRGAAQEQSLDLDVFLSRVCREFLVPKRLVT